MDISKISTHSVKNTKKLGKISSGEGSFSLEETAEIIKSAAPSEIKFSSIDALFLNLDLRRKGQKQAVEKSEKLLEQLDDLRLSIITGSIPRNTLQNLSSILQDKIETVADERLRNILLEIETRAKVELAKLEKMGQ